MKIYTKTGDSGKTSLFGGERVYKSHQRVEAYGSVDELNSFIGLLRDSIEDQRLKNLLLQIQNELFVVGSYLATPPQKKTLKSGENRLKILPISPENITVLEQEMDQMNLDLPKMTHFILPGGHTVVSYCHITRNVCRRVERNVVKLSKLSEVDSIIIQYLNRLSDYLFVLARKLAKEYGIEEIKWNVK